MYTLLAPEKLGTDYTGIYWLVKFENGVGQAPNDFLRRALMREGAVDITPEDEAYQMRHRPLKSILLARWGAFGDNLIMSPVAKALRQKYPDAVIHVTGKQPQDTMWGNNPYIDGVISCRNQDFVLVASNYDEAYDLSGSIEQNPTADWKNAAEIACDWVQAHPTDGDYKPIFVPLPSELDEALHALQKLGVNVLEDNVVLVHGESTSLLRRLPPLTQVQVWKLLAERGYKVLVASRTDATQALQDTSEEIKNNIVSLHEVMQLDNPRIGFALLAYVDFVIATDSSYSHAAAALDVPSLLIYGPFDPVLRAKHYKHASILHRPLPCGPCQQLASKCVRYGVAIPPCMSQYSAEEIVDAAEEVMAGAIKRDVATQQFRPDQVRFCPVCQSDKYQLVTRKGQYFYVMCSECGTLFTHVVPNAYELDRAAKKFGPSLLHYEQFSDIMIQVADAHGLRRGGSLNAYAYSRYREENINYFLKSKHRVTTELGTGTRDMFGIYHGDLAARIEECYVMDTYLKAGGILVWYGPCADAGRRYGNSWKYLNGAISGFEDIVPSIKGAKMVAKRYGFDVKKIDRIDDDMIVVMQKRVD